MSPLPTAVTHDTPPDALAVFLITPGIPDFSDASRLSRVKRVDDNAWNGLIGTSI